MNKKTIDEKIKELDRRHQAERDKEITKACSEDLRRQILIAKFLMEKRPNEFEKIIQDNEFNSFVTLDIDRKLFGFEKKEKKFEKQIRNRIFLNVSFEKKDLAKEIGKIHWDNQAKSWWVYEDEGWEKFGEYLPEEWRKKLPEIDLLSTIEK